MEDGYLGEIRFFAGNFAPKNWMYCMGQLLPVNENQALYSLLGTYYGGDGRNNFALPDFRGRTAVNPDDRIDLKMGNKGGQENVTLTSSNIPSHNHTILAISEDGNTINPANAIFAQPTGQVTIGRDTLQVNSNSYLSGTSNLVDMNPGVIYPTGSGLPHNNMQPFIGMNYIICVKGIYPDRN